MIYLWHKFTKSKSGALGSWSGSNTILAREDELLEHTCPIAGQDIQNSVILVMLWYLTLQICTYMCHEL